MNVYFLDAGGAGLYFLVIGLFILFMVLAILLEAAIMIWMKYNTTLKKTFLDSLIINIASLAAGFLLLNFFDALGNYTLSALAILYAVTVIIETTILQLLNRKHKFSRTLLVSLLMNLVTYIILYAIAGGK